MTSIASRQVLRATTSASRSEISKAPHLTFERSCLEGGSLKFILLSRTTWAVQHGVLVGITKPDFSAGTRGRLPLGTQERIWRRGVHPLVEHDLGAAR